MEPITQESLEGTASTETDSKDTHELCCDILEAMASPKWMAKKFTVRAGISGIVTALFKLGYSFGYTPIQIAIAITGAALKLEIGVGK